MATEQVLKWVTNDLRLSKTIHSFEMDFSNGYLFGEILCQFGIYDDVKVFSKNTNKEAKVNNFYLIEDAMRILKVRFDGKMTHSIMQEERGAALRLLYQLKLALQKREGPPADALEATTMTNLKVSTVRRMTQTNLRHTQSMAGMIKPRTVNGRDVRTNKQRREESAMVRFQVAKMNLFDKAVAQDEGEKTLIRSIQQRKRAENRQKLKENQEFMHEWEQEGLQNWKLNQKTRSETIAKNQYYEDREVLMYKAKLSRELEQATREMSGGVQEFEKNLQKLGVEQHVNIDDAVRKQEEKKGIPPGQIQNFSFPATMNKIKETKKQSDFAGKERERRRRKLAVDQANTQARLDKQKQEDLLVAKLLGQQREEQELAYSSRRQAKCKQMLAGQRRAKALEVQAAREVKRREMEAEAKVEAKRREKQRKLEIEEQNQRYILLAKEKKLKNRKINVEIASGIVDLIMDMSEEVFDVVQSQPGRKLTKAQWREFSGIFVEGKKCSLRHIKKQIVDAEQASKSEEAGLIDISSDFTAVQVLSRFGKEPAMNDMFQFISNSGCFNLDQLRADLFFEQSEQLKIEHLIIASNGRLVSNHDLGQIVQDLYKNAKPLIDQKSSKDVSFIVKEAIENKESEVALKDEKPADQQLREINDTEQDEQSSGELRIPTELPLKLAILGRAFSGKKTIAKELQERYGGEKRVKIFNMDEIIKEALDYITPKKIDEAALEAAKKAKKGKQDEQFNADIFEGKHPAEYKRLAAELKAQFFPDYESPENLPQKVDLPNVVFNDELLVNLFVERLKLAYEGNDAYHEKTQEELEEGIRREKELVEQLAEMDESLQSLADAGKKGGKAVKGGKGATSDDAMREELEQIRTLQPQGWILVDFPRNLTQMKLLESTLSGFVPRADQAKPDSQMFFEAWSKVASPPGLLPESAKGDFTAFSSGLDGVLIMNTPDSECIRRSQNRKVDPQTQIVYQMETEAPEDQKVLDRLQDYTDEAGLPERMQKISTGFNQSIQAIKQWLTRFGLKSSTNQCQVQLDMEINVTAVPEDRQNSVQASSVADSKESIQESVAQPAKDPWKIKKVVLDTVIGKVNAITEFRQREFDLKRANIRKQIEDREEQERLASIKAQEEEKSRQAEEQAKKEAEQKAAQVQGSDEKQVSAQVAATGEEEGSAGKQVSSQGAIVIEHNDNLPDTAGSIGFDSVQKVQDAMANSIEKADQDTRRNFVTSRRDDGGLRTIDSNTKPLSENMNSVGSRSMGRSTKFSQRVLELNDKQKIIKWEEMLNEYFKEGIHGFQAMRNLRQRVFQSLNETQDKFIQYLGRKNDQQSKINEFCDNYNRFSSEFPDLIGNPETDKELKNRIQIVSKLLWENIKARKQEALAERQGQMEGGWVQVEMIKLCGSIARLLENEFRRFSTISAVVTGSAIDEDIDLQGVVKKLTERGVEPYIADKEDRMRTGHSPQLVEVAQTALGKVEQLFKEPHVQILDYKVLKVLNIERQNFSMRLNVLITWALLILHEISCQALSVFDAMDDWVVIAVKCENQACQVAVKELNKAVERGQLYLGAVPLEQIDLRSHISTTEFFQGPPQYMVDARPIFTLDQARFTQDSLNTIYRQFRQYQEDTNLMDVHTFESLMLLNMQAQPSVLPNVWRFVPFDTIISLAKKLEAQALTDSMSDPRSLNLFKRKTQSMEFNEACAGFRKFIDWRKAFLIFALIAGRLPTTVELQEYITKLRDCTANSPDQQISRAAFSKVKAWFDKVESMTLQNATVNAISTAQFVATVQQSKSSTKSPVSLGRPSGEGPGFTSEKLLSIDASLNGEADDEDDEDDLIDLQRLSSLKELIYDVYRVQNREIIDLEVYISDLQFVFREHRTSDSDERTLYQTWLNLQ